MNRILSVLLLLSMIVTLSLGTAGAEDAGIVLISAPESNKAEPATLDDVKLKSEIKIPGYATFTALACQTVNAFEYYLYNDWSSVRTSDSGVEAEYIIFDIAVKNITTAEIDFRNEIKDIRLSFENDDGTYVFGGTARQYNYNKSKTVVGNVDTGFSIQPLYYGYYQIRFTIPNTVVTEQGPITITFKLGENDVIFNYRK